MLATDTLTGLNLQNHTITVEYPGGRLNSQTTQANLVFDVTHSSPPLGFRGDEAFHPLTISATRDDSDLTDVDLVSRQSTIDIALGVNVRPGINTYTIRFIRTDTNPDRTSILSPTVSIHRNRIAASPQDVATNDSTPIEIDLSPEQDADGDNLKITITQLPSDGRLEQINGTAISVGSEVSDSQKRVRFIPKLDSAGTRTFQFKANDTFEDSATATVTIAITDAPPSPPAKPDLLAESDTGPTFVANSGTDDFTRGIGNEASRVLRFSVGNVQPGGSAQLLRNGVQTGNRVTSTSGGSVILEAPVGSSTGIFNFTAIQFDSNSNPSPPSEALPVTIDVIAPEARNIQLTQRQASTLLVPIVVDANPTIRFDLSEQIFTGKDNRVQVLLKDHATGLPLGSQREQSFLTGSQPGCSVEQGAAVPQKKCTIEMTAPLGTRTGEQTIRLEVTDTANNQKSFTFTVFVLDPGDPTPEAPNTPVFSTLFYLGAELTRPALANQNIIFVDRQIPQGFSLNIEGTTYFVNQSEPQPEGDFRLTLSIPLTKAYAGRTPTTAGQRMTWLRPWTQTFDRTTQTTWFTMEDGHRLGQFDPATGKAQLYEVDFQPGLPKVGYDPHGTFFDFATHLTPRVWFTLRNENVPTGANSGENDTPQSPKGPAPPDERARMAYLDLATRKLFTFDFDALNLVTAHNVQVDDQGTVWMTAEDSNVIVELDFDFNPDGTRTPSLNSSAGRVVVHTIPEDFGGSFEFKVHGLQIVVDQRTGERYVWFSDAENAGATGRIALLRPGQPGANGQPPTSDQWFEWNLDEALFDEGRLDASPDGHALFIAIDDRETPGIPEDDQIVFGDSGLPRDPQGAVRFLDPSNVIRAMQQGQPLPVSSKVRSVRVPKLPGTSGSFAATVQVAIDREGNVFFADPSGGIGRFHPDGPLDSGQTDPEIDACINRAVIITAGEATCTNPSDPTVPLLSSIQVDAIAMSVSNNALTPLNITFDPTAFNDARAEDRSSAKGIDQYEVAATPQRRNRNQQGPFRGTINAGSIAYGSLSESDYLSTTVMAETVRRQMAVVVRSNDVTNGLTQGRIAFSVRRDGHLIATVRADGRILDEQVDLSELEGGDNPDASYLFDGDPSAVIDEASGQVSVFGISRNSTPDISRLIVYRFNGGAAGWTNEILTSGASWSRSQVDAPAGSLLVGNPTGFVDSSNQAGAIATSQKGDLLLYNPRLNALMVNLNNSSTNSRVYSSVAVLNPDNPSAPGQMFVYGTNQKGQLLEFAFTDAAIPANLSGVVVPTGNAADRNLMVFQDVYATLQGAMRHIFAVDGNARLVHFEIDPVKGTTVENVTAKVQAAGSAYGYLSSQQDGNQPAASFTQFGGRVYSGLAAEVDSTGVIYVYGTNGQDLIEFKRTASGSWQAANLTNDIYSTSGPIDGSERIDNQPPNQRVSANVVFGAPAAYLLENGERHIVQINAFGEVVEYYFVEEGQDFGRFQTQNVTLRLAPIGVNDVYRTAPGQPLTVLASTGVLANDRLPTSLPRPAGSPNGPDPRLSAIQLTPPANGKVQFNDRGEFTYTPEAGFVGTDTFFYQVQTEFGASPAVPISIIVEPIDVGTIIDDGRPGYSQKGTWISRQQAGNFDGDFRENAAGTGKDVATWTFTRLPAGEYEVFTRWSAAPTRATNTPYSILDNTRVVGGQVINQRQATEGELAAGFAWKSLGTVTIESGTLKVTLNDRADGSVSADAVRVVRRSLATTLDDGQFGYSQRGSWQTRRNNNAVGGDFRESARGTGKDVAEWKFTELPDGEYQVFTHWVAGSNRATNAPYSIFDNNTRLTTQSVNQKVAPGGETFNGFRWHSLGTVTVTSGVLKITLSDKANGAVSADAVRIAPTSGTPLQANDLALLSLMETLTGRRK